MPHDGLQQVSLAPHTLAPHFMPPVPPIADAPPLLGAPPLAAEHWVD
jgi:hypothetical protein